MGLPSIHGARISLVICCRQICAPARRLRRQVLGLRIGLNRCVFKEELYPGVRERKPVQLGVVLSELIYVVRELNSGEVSWRKLLQSFKLRGSLWPGRPTERCYTCSHR